MANLKSIYKSEYMRGEDVPVAGVTLTISSAEVVANRFEPGESCVELAFVEDRQKLTLNKTNAKACGKAFGLETDNWIGKKVALARVKVRNPKAGTMVDSVAVVPVAAKNDDAADEL